MNEQYTPAYQRYAPRFKPYTFDEIDSEKN
jgi:hypothetical protein